MHTLNFAIKVGLKPAGVLASSENEFKPVLLGSELTSHPDVGRTLLSQNQSWALSSVWQASSNSADGWIAGGASCVRSAQPVIFL